MLPRTRTFNTKLQTVVMTFIFVTAVFVLSAHFTQFVFAQEAPSPAGEDIFGVQELDQEVQLTGTDIRIIIGRIIRAVLGLLGIISLVLIIYGGFLIMTSGGNDQKVEEGKKFLINAAIGLAIILSALAIVQFILNALDRAIRGGEGGEAGPRIRIDSFEGSGGLGRIIKDHYPFRDETNVPRNVRIAITFAEPIDPASIIRDVNGNGIFGDCRQDGAFDWREDCDHLISDAIKLYVSTSTLLAALGEDAFVSAAALASYDNAGNATTFTFKPFEILGNNETPVWYTVHVSNRVKVKATDKGIFEGRSGTFYAWEFQTGTIIDDAPPHVTQVIPHAQGQVAKNSIIQVNFNEPMDPTTVQGIVGEGNPFINLVFQERQERVSGEWKISNGYKTLEFLSDKPCGLNSCGEIMYCLPVACVDPNNQQCTEDYEILVRTSELLNPESWEAVPFSGVVDMAGNALDGDNDLRRDGKPPMGGDFTVVRAAEKRADNYFWDFAVRNHIDRSAPVITRITPRVDQENVGEDVPLQLTVNKPLWSQTLREIQLEEHPVPRDIDPLWFAARIDVKRDEAGNDFSEVTILHRAFGPDDSALYYFPSIPSSVKSLNQNCFYPGKGPAARAGADQCGGAVPCVPVTIDAGDDTGCAIGNAGFDATRGTVKECVDALKNPNVSPLQQ